MMVDQTAATFHGDALDLANISFVTLLTSL